MAGLCHRYELLRTEDTEDLSLQRPGSGCFGLGLCGPLSAGDSRSLSAVSQSCCAAQRSIVSILACPRELPVDRRGNIELEGALKDGFLRLLRLELNLGAKPQTVRLVEELPHVGSPEDDSLPSMQSTLPLPDDARVLGFRFQEATDGSTGFADVRNPHVLLDIKGTLHLEPMSRRYLASGSVEFPGCVRWMPAALEALEKDGTATRWDAAAIAALPEVLGLKFFQGTAVDHLSEVEYADTCAGFAANCMFWIDLLVLTFALFYLDIVLDIKQLLLFGNSELYGYLALNLAGMALPPIFTTLEAIEFSANDSAEKDRLERLLSPTLLLPAVLAAIITQTLMAVLVALSAVAHRKHPLLAGAKMAEVAESAVSALVQTNFLISALGGIEQIRALELSDDQLQSLALSVAVSCFSLGLGFAGRDKADSAVLGLPGKLGWRPSFACLIFARFLEVLSRMVAYSVLQISLRGYPLLRLTGLGAGAFALLAALLAFPEASWADLAAAVIAHPGQILEPQSLLKLRYSLMIHMVLVAAAGGAQLLLQATTGPTACKALPDMLLIAWLVVSLVSWAALGLFSWLGHYVDQPRFVALASGGDEPVIAYSSLRAAFPGSDGQVPKAVLAALQGKFAVDLSTDATARGLTQQGLERILESGGDAHFGGQVLENLDITRKAVVDGLATSQRTILRLPQFWGVPADAWGRLGASLDGERLRKVDLYACFHDSGEGSHALLAGLARCQNLQELVMDFCQEVAWAELRAAEWPELRKASFQMCFPWDHRGRGEGSQAILSALGRSGQLEELNFERCDAFPYSAWKLLSDGTWPRLRVAKGVPEEHLQRLRKAPLDLEAGSGFRTPGLPASRWQSPCSCEKGLRGEAASSTELQEHGAAKLQMYPSFVTSVLMANAALEVQQDGNLLPALARSDAEELNMNRCKGVPAAVWQKLGGQGDVFQKLRKASFAECFEERAEGVEGLLLALSRCQQLQELDLNYCSKIPAAAWQQLEGATWQKLKTVSFDWCFGEESRAEGAAGLLAALARCPELKDLSMDSCSEIPAAAWQQLVDGAKWPKLTKVSFNECFGFGSKGIEAAAGLLAFLGRCPELKELSMRDCSEIPAAAWQQLVDGAKWPKLTKVSFNECFHSESKGIEAAAGLLAFLGRCPELKDLSMACCSKIPAAAWQQLVDGAKWPKLTKVSFNECFGRGSKGIEAAAGLLAFLGRCPELKELHMEYCDQIPAAAWQQLENATWPKLTEVNFDWCVGADSAGADGAAGLLAALACCPELEDNNIRGLSDEHMEELCRLRQMRDREFRKSQLSGLNISLGTMD